MQKGYVNSLAVPKFSNELGQVSSFNLLINWHHHMRDHVEIGHLTKYDAFRVSRDQVMDIKYGSKSIQMSLILRQRPSKPYKLLTFSISFMTTCRRCGGLMVRALDYWTSSRCSSPGRGHCVVFLDKTLYSHGASLHPGVYMGTSELNAGG